MPEIDATNINQLRKIILKAPERLEALNKKYKKVLKAYREAQAEHERIHAKKYLTYKAKEDLSIQDAEYKAKQDDEVWSARMMSIAKESEYKGVRNELNRIDFYFTGAKKCLDSLTQEQKYMGG